MVYKQLSTALFWFAACALLVACLALCENSALCQSDIGDVAVHDFTLSA